MIYDDIYTYLIYSTDARLISFANRLRGAGFFSTATMRSTVRVVGDSSAYVKDARKRIKRMRQDAFV